MMSGKLLKQRYQIVEILKTGGFCQTYLAKDIAQPNLPKCIIKQLSLPKSDRPNYFQKNVYQSLKREVKALKTLNTCDRVPQLLAYFEEDRQLYLVQKFIDGYSLAIEIYPGCCWSESRVIELLCEVLEILAVVHSYGFIHRNIKPSNLIRQNNTHRLVLIDFGAAKQTWQQMATESEKNYPTFVAKEATVAMGTPGYMPAEQERGTPRPSSDIYALGIMAIQALTGLSPTQLLIDSETGEILWQQHAKVSREFADILSSMVSYHFKDRYQSAAEALNALQKTLVNLPISSTRQEMPAPVIANAPLQKIATNPNVLKFKPSLSIIFSAIAFVLTLLGGSYYLLQSPSSTLKAEKSLVTAAPKVTLVHTLESHTNVVWCAVSSFDGQTLISSSGDKTIKVWNLLTGKLLRTLKSNSQPVLSVAISQSDRTIASGSYSNNQAVNLWDFPTGTRHNLKGDSNGVWSVAISPNERLLASSNQDGSIEVWNLRDRKLRYRLLGHLNAVWSVAISSDNQLLASASSDKTINLWDLRSRELLHTFSGHSDRVRTVAFSPNGQIIASGSWDKSIKIWNVKTKALLSNLSGHSDRVNSVAISPNGQLLASGSDDGTIKLWDLPTGKLLQTLKQHFGNVNSVSFNPDGNILISGSGDQTIKIWSLKP
ncbi:serine/threonine-protein kinase [Synechocystis sp. PCC 7509]|uniref:serine/threonine-protein kinase n=1 Tax=Synechocystis sp. PCC 7509 TaxID=927677 RepID=UPI0002AD1838|nr:serine/threonine-protein kinase [Synechocystis sp. PCC 7509]